MVSFNRTAYEKYFLTVMALDSYNRGSFVNVKFDQGFAVGDAIITGRLGEELSAAEMSAFLGENNFTILSAQEVGIVQTGAG